MGNPLTAFVILDRGYTGHEHLLGVALIHMNGRLYDPKLHRFLSPDNYVQDPLNTQNFNRYGYVLNNPLSHVDPSGELFWFVPVLIIIGKAALIGAGIGAASYTASVAFSKGGFDNWNWGQFGKSAGIGAISGVATAGIGAAFGHATGTLLNEVGRSLAHGLVNGGISEFTGGDFMQGFASGALGSLAGSGFQALGDFAKTGVATIGFSALSGGVGAELTGGDFWRGAATGATVATLNHFGGKVLGNDPTQKTLDDLKATSEAIGYTADGATIFMGTYKGKKFYYTNINGNIKWIPTSKITSVISNAGKVGLGVGLAADVFSFVSGNQSGTQTVLSMSWAGGTALLNLGLRGNIFSGLLYNALFTDFAQPARPIYYRAPFGLPDNTRVTK
ncbi:RHS repeat-associated core domain-containing protein [Pseudopedobacter beijingensis]|uniref:RHS repeat-associated core domain-containing protein n=1 Tax=Pseudopedobacter beijingensis TaxID=1207056 RepID=A0ABW4IHG4_9SPHI